MLKLTLQYFGHLMQRADLLRKTLMLGKTEGKGQRMRWFDSIVDSVDMSKLWESQDRGAWHAAMHGKKSDMTEQLKNNSTIVNTCYNL